uniref:Uncharacterized protein n=1 Tax=Brassica campestris TaxID=3711 RepID=A0A3P5Y218_BRACM|nr:unnamed protein product [Brassica rapa]
MGSRSESEDQLTFDTHYSPPNTVDFGTHEGLGTLAAADEFADQILEGGVTRDDGNKQGNIKRIISLVDDTDDSDVEITQPTQKTKPRRQTIFRIATRNPMLKSTIDGGVGSSVQACSKGKSIPMKSLEVSSSTGAACSVQKCPDALIFRPARGTICKVLCIYAVQDRAGVLVTAARVGLARHDPREDELAAIRDRKGRINLFDIPNCRRLYKRRQAKH